MGGEGTRKGRCLDLPFDLEELFSGVSFLSSDLSSDLISAAFSALTSTSFAGAVVDGVLTAVSTILSRLDRLVRLGVIESSW